MRIPTCLFLMCAAWSSWAQESSGCASRELKTQSCVLRLKDFKATLSAKKITWLHGPWRSIADFPEADKIASWDSVQARILNHRVFLEFKVWEKEPGEVSVETLTWIVAEVKDKTFKVRLSKPIGMRKPEFINDATLKTKLSFQKGAGVEWSTGKEQGFLDD